MASKSTDDPGNTASTTFTADTNHGPGSGGAPKGVPDATTQAPVSAAAGESGVPTSSGVAGSESAQQATPAQERKEGGSSERPEWETARTLKEYWSTRKTFFTETQRAEAWEETAKIVQDYSDELVDRWNKEMDNLLIYAGLFSAIQTAFNVELYKRLTPDPDPDPILVALERISAQLSGFAVNLAFVNSTQPGFVLGDAKTPDVPAWVVVLNALWFSSLISSLAAASIAIMAKQWLTEYKSGVSGTTRQTARLRQLRLNSLKQWRVEEIVSFLPVLLQIASGLFFAGLLILLWNLNRTVAIIGTVLVGILAVFSFSTIILPSVAAHCSYLSPPSRLLFALTRPCWRALYLFRRQLSSRIASYYYCYARELYHFDLNCADAKQFRGKHPHIYRLCKMLFPRDRAHTLVWRGMESALVSQHTQALDGEMVATAYMTSMNTNFLHRAAMCTTELSLSAMRTCFQAIMSANIAHWGTDGHREPMRLVHPCMWSGALIALMDASGNDTAWSPSTLVAALDTVYKYIGTSSQQLQSDTPATRLLCVDFTRIICHYDPSTLPPDFLNIAEHLYRFKLQSIMGGTRDMNLGNDVRQHVVSACIGDALKGFEGIIEDASIKRALFALRCIIYCVPSKTGSDYKCDDPEYKAIQSQAARALEAFSNFLSTSPSSAGRCTFEIDDVLDALRKHGEGAGLMSVELRRAIVRYWDSADEYIRLYLRDNKEWIQTLRGESGQNTAAGVASTSGGTADPPIVAAPTAACRDSVSVAAASQQISGTRDGIQTVTVPVNESSTPSTSPPPTARIASAVVLKESVASSRGAADAHPPTELDANGRSASAAPPPSVRTAAVDESTSSSPSAVEDDRGAQLSATGSSTTAAPLFSDRTASVSETAGSVPGTAQGDRGARSQEELATNRSSSASATPPPSSGGSGLP